MNETLENVKNEDTINFTKNKDGVSLIALVITIIVVIILAAIAFNSSTTTIGKANYSKFVTNISEVQNAIRQKMITVKGTMMANGTEVTDGQIYNYIAKGGTSESDILVESKVPDYTVIEKKADIGIKLPVMKVNTPTQTGAEVKYAVTDNGVIFIWPPFPHEEKYYVNENETVDADVISSSGELEIKVADKLLKIESNEEGEIQTKEIIYDGLTRKEFEEIKEKVKVGDYVNYPLMATTVNTDLTKTGYWVEESLTTDTSAKWRILSIDEDTGKILIATHGPVNKVTLHGAEGYVYGADELNRICNKLYSNTGKGLTAKNMTIEDLNKASGYVPQKGDVGFAWYINDATDEELKDIKIDEKKIYTAKRHTKSFVYEMNNPRFYTWDDEKGTTHTSSNVNDYNDNVSNTKPILVSETYYCYNPGFNNSVINSILGGDDTHKGWLASSYVYLGGEYVHFGMYFAYSNLMDGFSLYASNGNDGLPSYGLRPVVSFNINRLNTSDTTKTGSESTPWEIK